MKALSGYATTNRGKQVAFAIFSNNFNLPPSRVTETIDNLAKAIVEDAEK